MERLPIDGLLAIAIPATQPVAPPAHLVRAEPTPRQRLRDSYIAARFPGVARSSAELVPGRVIDAARLYFEDERTDDAAELLQLAIEQRPREASLWLAQLEIVFLMRDANRYCAVARAFHASHPKSPAWPEVMRLGRAIAPGEAFFGAGGATSQEPQGPWPQMPNWIKAPWDLTSEVMATDFHRAMARRALENE